MPIFKGSSKQGKIYVGETKIGKVYKVDTLVYQSAVKLLGSTLNRDDAYYRMWLFNTWSQSSMIFFKYVGYDFVVEQIVGTLGASGSYIRATASSFLNKTYKETIYLNGLKFYIYSSPETEDDHYMEAIVPPGTVVGDILYFTGRHGSESGSRFPVQITDNTFTGNQFSSSYVGTRNTGRDVNFEYKA